MNFLGKVVSNHTAFIRIRTNQFISPNQFLILPVEIEVTTGMAYSSLEHQLSGLKFQHEPC